MKPIRHTSTFGDRLADHGRIRTGNKVMGKKGLEPRTLPHFRFTSPDLAALTTLAERYGGEPAKWDEPKAAVRNQYELYTEAPEIDVLLPEGALSVFYEAWSGGGCQRRCDGETCTSPGTGPDGDDTIGPCICTLNNLLVCKPKTRLKVVLPGIQFKGAWRYESTSWAVADEMSGMEPIIQQMQGRGILRARLAIEQRSKMTPKGKRNFQVTRLVLAATPEELASGQAGLPGIPVVQREIEAPKEEAYVDPYDNGDDGEGNTGPVPPSHPSSDDEPVDAEIIEPRTRAEAKTELLLLFDSNVEECAQAWAYANGDEMEWDSGTAGTIYDRWNGRPM